MGIVFILLLLFHISFHYFFEQNLYNSLQIEFDYKATYIKEKILPNLSLDKNIISTKFPDVEIAIIKENKIIYQTQSFRLTNFKKYLGKEDSFWINDVSEKFEVEREEAVYVADITEPFAGSLVLYKKKIDNRAEEIENVLLLLNPILMLLLIVVVGKLIDQILLKIENVTKATQELNISNFSEPIEMPKENDEIRKLIESFNTMATRLKEGVTTLDRFNSNVSHELKTPLTVIKGEIEITLKQKREVEYYIKSLSTILYETTQIEAIVENLLILTSYSKQTIQETFELCYFDSILLNSIEKYEQQLEEKEIKLHIIRMDAIHQEANLFLITAIFSNLLDNAIKYSLSYKNISITLLQEDKIHFIIKDEGIGIPADKIEQVTDRFYRVDKSRNKKIQGVGLGLSIVKSSVELHNGILDIQSDIDKGTSVEIII